MAAGGWVAGGVIEGVSIRGIELLVNGAASLTKRGGWWLALIEPPLLPENGRKNRGSRFDPEKSRGRLIMTMPYRVFL